MKLHEKIRKIRVEKELSLKELHRLMFNDFKDKTVAYRTLLRVEAGDTDGRGSTLYQISTALGISLSQLKKDTEEENKLVDFVKKTKRMGRYVFNEKVYADLLMRQNHNFMAVELVLSPGGSTQLERDPQVNPEEELLGKIKFEKYIYCLRGKITCYIGQERYTLKNGDGLSFPSAVSHWFENSSKSNCHCLIFQNPRYL